MTSTFHSIETSKRALFAQQAALSTVGHNIANANTEGFSRQRVNMVTATSIEAYGMNKSNAPGQLGTGVEYSSITRIRNAFLDQQFRDQNDNVGSLEIQTNTLSKLEGYVAEPSDHGIRTVIEKFWKSWSDISKDTISVTGREILAEVSKGLADSFNDFNRQLTNLNNDLTSSIEVKAAEINSTWSSISELNKLINRLEILGDHANDLRDQRDLLTDKLSKLANISVMDTEQGYVINLAGTTLADGVTITADSLQAAYASGNLTGGETHGYIVSRDIHVKDFAYQLKMLANTLVNGEITVEVPAGTLLPGETTPLTESKTITVNGINGLHRLGFTLDEPAERAGDFFDLVPDHPNSDNPSLFGFTMKLNDEIANNTNKIAASLKGSIANNEYVVVKGSNDLALLMSELATVNFSFDETATGGGIRKATINSFYSASVGALGVQTQEANRLYKNSYTQLSQIDENRLAVSNVSLDEEMSDLIKFQYAYSSSARFMTTIDEVLNKLINGTGRVGL